MSGFRNRFARINSVELSSQNAGIDPAFRGYDKASFVVSRPSDSPLLPGPQFLIDTVPGDTSSTATLTVGAARIVSAVDTIADQDFYRIELVAGHQYQIGMYGYTPTALGDPIGPNGIPLLDSYLELYDSAGNFITAADGGSDTVLNGANSGFDALLTFTATTTGTYFVNARAFDNLPDDGDDGDMIGDYGLYAEDVTGDESLYTPYYSPDSPLYAIDWGTQVNKVHQTYRNPDGDEGTRDTGNAQSPVDPGALLGHPGKNVISIYFAQAGDIFVSNDPTNPGLPPATITATGVQDFEHLAVMTALHEFEKVADIIYVEVTDRAQADFIYTSYIGTPGPGVSLLGSMSPPDESDEGLAQFNSGDYRWNAVDLQQGGFSFVTLIHEFGHGHGLAHPHDNGGHSGIMNGVEAEGAGVADYTTGDFHLNQAVFTMMSYEDGWQDSPYDNAPTDVGYGYLGGLMAFDIAAIQDKYGVNEDTATGNDTYVLKDVNEAGTYYSCIWDAGGIDAITYSGSRDTTIDLRPATLRYEEGGGGRVSFAYGIYGGFTIASGATIENAVSGSGNDILIGNDVANLLNGGAGNDTYFIDGNDQVVEIAGGGYDYVLTRGSHVLAAGASVELMSTDNHGGTAAINLTGNELGQVLIGNAGANVLNGGPGGADLLQGLGGNDTYVVDGDDRVLEDAGGGFDSVLARASFALAAGASVELMSTDNHGGTAAINLTGNELSQVLIGNAGANVLNGGPGGADLLQGLGGNDTYFVDGDDQVLEDVGGGSDYVLARTSYVLAAGASVELMSTDNHGGTAAINFTGNELSQVLIGNAGANVLSGGVGGADLLQGLGGNDTYFVDGDDQVLEAAGGGSDYVLARASFALTAGASVELMSTDNHGGTAAINLTGNELGQVLVGNAGANILNGGLGNDLLQGLGGNDTFAFTTALGAGNVDIVYDFVAGADKIALDDAVFTGLAPGALAASAFVAGTSALDADDRIIYDSATGALYFDADGVGGASAMVQFATLSPGLTLAAGDFAVI
jgi:serralysin